MLDMPADMLSHSESEGPGRASMKGERSFSPRHAGPERSLTFQLKAGENLDALAFRIAKALENITVLDVLVFGSTRSVRAVDEAIKRIFVRADWPMTWVEGEACDHQPIAGIQIAGFKGP